MSASISENNPYESNSPIKKNKILKFALETRLYRTSMVIDTNQCELSEELTEELKGGASKQHSRY